MFKSKSNLSEAKLLAFLLVIGLILFLGLNLSACNKTVVDRGIFPNIEQTLAQPGPVKDDLIKRGLVSLPPDNTTGGEAIIKVGEITKLVEAGVYKIDDQGYLVFGPNYRP
jgi:hypothetical protein